jgi:WD40 repeat protein
MVDLLPNNHNWSGSKITPLHVLSGQHHSRVFRCHFLSNEATLVTGGEDSFVCLWNCDTGEFKYRRKTHLGSPVWSLADIPDQKRIISGGGDASINSFIADDVSTRPVAACLELENVSEGDYPKLVSFISDTNWIICLTFNGTVKIICSQSGLQATLLQDDQLKNHPFMEVSGDLIFLANLQGYIMVARWTSSTPLPSCTIFHQHQVVCRRQNDQTFAMTYLKKSSNLLLSRANGNMELFDKTSDDRLVSKCIMVLPPCKQQRFFSCAMELGSPPSRIIVGDRCGNIHIYDKDSGVLCQSLNKVHGRHGVGSILSSRSHQNFTTVGRDGLLKTFELDHDQNTIKELSCQRLKINWLERQWSFNDEDYVLGFHSSNFVVHSIHR